MAGFPYSIGTVISFVWHDTIRRDTDSIAEAREKGIAKRLVWGRFCGLTEDKLGIVVSSDYHITEEDDMPQESNIYPLRDIDMSTLAKLIRRK